MEKSEKIRFIENLCNSVKQEIISKVDRMPENWDGYELRQLIADKFASESYLLKKPENKKRYKEFISEVIIKNI